MSTNQNAETVMPASWLKRGQVALILRRGDAGKNGAWSKHSTVDYFRFLFAYTGAMFSAPESSKLVVIQCKGCHENIPAPVKNMPAQPIAARCPLCHEHRRYLPSEVFLGRLSHLMIRKPVRTADGRPG